MAETLKEFNFSDYQRGHSKYPWSEWTDGQIWKVKHGVDFDPKPTSFACCLRSYALRKGLTIRTARFGEFVVFQFAAKEVDTPTKEG